MAANESPSNSDPRDRLIALADAILRAEEPLLFDQYGRPLSTRNPDWNKYREEWLVAASARLEDLIRTLSLSDPRSLGDQIRAQAETQDKFEFDIVDGDLTLPVRVRVGTTSIKAHIPIYKLLAAIGTGAWITTNAARLVKQVSSELFTRHKSFDVTPQHLRFPLAGSISTPAQTLYVRNRLTTTLALVVTHGSPSAWLSITPREATVSGVQCVIFNVRIIPPNLPAAGEIRGSIVVRGGNEVVKVEVMVDRPTS